MVQLNPITQCVCVHFNVSLSSAAMALKSTISSSFLDKCLFFLFRPSHSPRFIIQSSVKSANYKDPLCFSHPPGTPLWSIWRLPFAEHRNRFVYRQNAKPVTARICLWRNMCEGCLSLCQWQISSLIGEWRHAVARLETKSWMIRGKYYARITDDKIRWKTTEHCVL